MSEQSYDLVVIGSGPAGEKGAVKAAFFGKRVAVVEKQGEPGGAATNTGTLPSKTLRETSLMISGVKARDVFGLDVSKSDVTVADFLRRKKQVVTAERGRIRESLSELGVELIRGHGRFVDPHVVEVEQDGGEKLRLRAEHVLIATGSSPRRPDEFHFEDPRIHDSDTILRLDKIPQRLVVIGGGVIGSEYASIFAALGIETHVIDGRDELLPFLDWELSAALQKAMAEQLGVQFHLDTMVEECVPETDWVRVSLSNGKSIEADSVLIAAGRTSNTAKLGLEAAGITPGRRGLIEVDKNYATSVPHIYAAGDVIGFPALASTSMEQARLAIMHAFQLELDYLTEFPHILPFGIYTIPEVSMAGSAEEDLRAEGIDVVVGKACYGENPRGLIVGDHDGLLKLVFRRDGMKLAGVHVIGEQATELVHIGLMALNTEASAHTFVNTCFNYPTLSDLYKYAAYDALNKVKQGGSEGAEGPC